MPSIGPIRPVVEAPGGKRIRDGYRSVGICGWPKPIRRTHGSGARRGSAGSRLQLPSRIDLRTSFDRCRPEAPRRSTRSGGRGARQHPRINFDSPRSRFSGDSVGHKETMPHQQHRDYTHAHARHATPSPTTEDPNTQLTRERSRCWWTPVSCAEPALERRLRMPSASHLHEDSISARHGFDKQ